MGSIYLLFSRQNRQNPSICQATVVLHSVYWCKETTVFSFDNKLFITFYTGQLFDILFVVLQLRNNFYGNYYVYQNKFCHIAQLLYLCNGNIMAMHIQNITHNPLTINSFTPPQHHARVSEVKPLRTASTKALLHTAHVRGGRASLFLFLALTAMAFASCTKDGGGNNSTANDSTNAPSQYDERHWSWDKSNPGGILFDTAWLTDTTLTF